MYVPDLSSPKAMTPAQAGLMLKHLGYDGYEQEGFSFLDMFGAPGNSAHDSSSWQNIEQVRGWNYAAILAKSLQFALSTTHVFVSPEISCRIQTDTGDRTTEAAFISGVEAFDVPSDWVVAPAHHRVSRLIRRPNPWTDQAMFWFQISQHIETHGVCYLLVLPNENGQPSELYVVPKSQMCAYGGSTRFPEGYYRASNLSRFTGHREFEKKSLTLQQRLQSLSNQDYSAQFIIELGIPSLLYADDFLNPTSAIADSLDTDKEMHRARRNALGNQTTSGTMLSEEKGTDLQSDMRSQLLQEFQSRNSGPENQGKPWWKPKGVNVEPTTMSAREMEYAKSAEQMRDDILGQRLTPAALVGLGDMAGYAGVVAAVKAWSRMSGQPMMRMIAGQLTIGLQRFFTGQNTEFAIVMQAGNIDDPQTTQLQLSTDISAQSITTGEYRERVNLKPFGDERDEAIVGTLAAQAGSPGMSGTGLPGVQGGDTGPESPGIGVDPSIKDPQEEQRNFNGLSRRDFSNTRKGITETLESLQENRIRPKTARILLQRLQLSEQDIDSLLESVQDDPDPMIRKADQVNEDELDSDFAKQFFDRMEQEDTRRQVWDSFAKSSEPRDGDGDGYIYDGTPEERPASKKSESDESKDPETPLSPAEEILLDGEVLYGGWSPQWQVSATAEDFIAARNRSTRSMYLSPITPDDLKNHRLLLSSDGTVGVAVSPDGDIQNVFNNGGPRRGAAEAMHAAVAAGGVTLDCYDGHLPAFYSNFGFTETGRMKFNPEFAPEGWDFEDLGHPDVVFMARTEDKTDESSRRDVHRPRRDWGKPARATQVYEGSAWDRAKRDSLAASVQVGERQADPAGGRTTDAPPRGDAGTSADLGKSRANRAGSDTGDDSSGTDRVLKGHSPSVRRMPARTLSLEDGYTGYQVLKSAMKSKTCPRDGDGDGTVQDGTAQEKPVSDCEGDSKTLPDRKDRIKGGRKLVESATKLLLGTKGDRKKVLSSIDSSGVSNEQASSYTKMLNEAMDQLPPAMIDNISKNVEKVRLHGSIGDVTSFVDDLTGGERKDGTVTMGLWNPFDNSLNLDGGTPQGSTMTHRGLYVHELAHAADRLEDGSIFSDSSEWKSAYLKEIGRDDAPLSRYATVDSSEGFAEFLRYAGENPEDARKSFPRSTKAVERVYGRL